MFPESGEILLYPEPVALIAGMGEENDFHFVLIMFFSRPPPKSIWQSRYPDTDGVGPLHRV
jgi:hypothetical protein